MWYLWETYLLPRIMNVLRIMLYEQPALSPLVGISFIILLNTSYKWIIRSIACNVNHYTTDWVMYMVRTSYISMSWWWCPLCTRPTVKQHQSNKTFVYKRIGLVQSGPHHHLIENWIVLTMIWLKNCSLGIKQQSLYFVNLSLTERKQQIPIS
jgi:hypothetical protein